MQNAVGSMGRATSFSILLKFGTIKVADHYEKSSMQCVSNGWLCAKWMGRAKSRVHCDH